MAVCLPDPAQHLRGYLRVALYVERHQILGAAASRLRRAPQLQVGWIIVIPDPVLVVHFLIRPQRPSELAFHDVPVLQVPLAVYRDHPVPAGIGIALAVSSFQATHRTHISVAQDRDPLIVHRAVATGINLLSTALPGTLSAAPHPPRD